MAERLDFLKFLGTAGARFVMIKQLRRSGGLWLKIKDTSLLIDPGPGSLVRCLASRPKLDPSSLDGILITHRHLDHCNDVNVMIEAMTEGGFKKRGVVFCPKDAVSNDPVIFEYLRGFPRKIRILRRNGRYRLGDISFETSMRHIHPSETYGLKFKLNGRLVGLMSDTRRFDGLEKFYKVHTLILPVVFPQSLPNIDHLSFEDAKSLIKRCKPEQVILTHFGMRMLKADPRLLAESLARESRIEVTAAFDGMVLE